MCRSRSRDLRCQRESCERAPPDKKYILHTYTRRHLSLPARGHAQTGGQTARAQLEPAKSTLTAAFCVQPEITENAEKL